MTLLNDAPMAAPAHGLSDEQQALVDMVRDFARHELEPHAIEWDREKHFPLDVLHAYVASVAA